LYGLEPTDHGPDAVDHAPGLGAGDDRRVEPIAEPIDNRPPVSQAHPAAGRLDLVVRFGRILTL
jgi:hypothetical protein